MTPRLLTLTSRLAGPEVRPPIRSLLLTGSLGAVSIVLALLVAMAAPETFPVQRAAADSPPPARVDVAALENRFDPAVITITVGSTVRWTNRDITPHSTTSDTYLWNWTMVPGARFSATFLSPGIYPYHCTYHRAMGMTGRVVVIPSVIPGPTIPPPPIGGGDGDIVYDYYPDGMVQTSDLLRIRPDGTGKVQLTHTADLYEAQPNWSPDRQRIAYTAGTGASVLDAWKLHVLDVATGQTMPISAGPEHYEPDWSPDGSLIAYTGITREERTVTGSSIGVVQPDGLNQRTLIALNSLGFAIANPTWSPDGARIAFTVRSDAVGGELYVMNANGTGARRLFAHSGWDDLDPAWSPDGRYIAFASGIHRGAVQATPHDIWVLDLASGVFGIVVSHPVWDLRQPAWSPNGRYLVFSAQVESQPDAQWALYMVPATGGAVLGPLTAGAEPDWGSEALVPLPTPYPGATPTLMPPPPPPLFPTFPPPEPTLPGPPPTFPAPPEVTPTPGMVVRGRIYLSIARNGTSIDGAAIVR